VVTFDLNLWSYSTPGPVSAWMGDHLNYVGMSVYISTAETHNKQQATNTEDETFLVKYAFAGTRATGDITQVGNTNRMNFLTVSTDK